MYFLDTNICIAIIQKHHNAIEEFENKADLCYISTIVLSELNGLLNLLGIVDFDTHAAQKFGIIQAQLRLIGKPTGELDALIAAVVLSQEAMLVPNNIRDFENIQNLKLENWLVSP